MELWCEVITTTCDRTFVRKAMLGTHGSQLERILKNVPSGLLPPCEDRISLQSASDCRSCESWSVKPGPGKTIWNLLVSNEITKDNKNDKSISGEGNNVNSECTVQNWIPLTLLPSLSRGGDQHMMPITFGTTSRIPPATPDFAGKPTFKQTKKCEHNC